MRYLSPGRLLGVVGAIAVALVTVGGGFMSPVLAMPAAATGPVATKPAAGTPQLVRTSGVQNIRQLVQCGTMMYAVGSFTEISQGGKNYSRNNVFSFSATAPYTVSGWNVNVNGDVNSIAFTSSNGCADAYIGGSFTSVHGTAATNIAEVSTSTSSPFCSSCTSSSLEERHSWRARGRTGPVSTSRISRGPSMSTGGGSDGIRRRRSASPH